MKQAATLMATSGYTRREGARSKKIGRDEEERRGGGGGNRWKKWEVAWERDSGPATRSAFAKLLNAYNLVYSQTEP